MKFKKKINPTLLAYLTNKPIKENISTNKKKMKVGDKIRDVEDGDVYYEGIIETVNPITYKVTKVVGAKKIPLNEVVEKQLWYIEKL